MNEMPSPIQTPADQKSLSDVLVIGGGPVGVRMGRLLAKSGRRVTLLSEESHAPYNRVRLTPLLGGDVQFGDIVLPESNAAIENLFIHLGQRAVRIDRDAKFVETADGTIWPFKTLVFATGSRAFIPNIPGTDKPGVYAFRTADDASALLARSFSARRVTILGGGLLGLEAARGLSRRKCEVTVVEHENRLMPRQLDEAAAAHLKASIEDLGVKVLTGTRVAEIQGDFRVEKVLLSDGSELESDTVVICTGVRANTQLASDAGLPFDRGILVNAQMQTRDPAIYAVGECAQFGDQVVGLVGPGYAQADAAAAAIAGLSDPYVPAIPSTKLKVIGADVFSFGPVEQLEVTPNVRSYVWASDTGYRRIFIRRGKLVGVIAVGKWEQVSRVQETAQTHANVYPWMLYQFRKTGNFWPVGDAESTMLPDAATVCNCTGVTCGKIRAAILNGAETADQISAETGASTVCGTCKPLVEQLINADAPPKPVSFSKPLMAFSGIAILLALIPLLFGYVPLPTSYDAESLRTWAWRDNITKQWSGFILFGVMCAAMLIGLRKRIRFFDRFGGYDGWRLVHIVIGLLAVGGFFAHTGFRMGDNWNFLLAIAFILTLIMGATAGMATGGDHKLREQGIGSARKPARRLPTWLHIIAIWPLPALILFHVLTIYAF